MFSRVKAEFVAAYIKTYIKRLIEIRRSAENIGIPGFRLFKMSYLVNERA
jgi:hypothetical protein